MAQLHHPRFLGDEQTAVGEEGHPERLFELADLLNRERLRGRGQVRLAVGGGHVADRRILRRVLGHRLARRGGLRRSEEHTSELQSLMRNSYAVFCLKKKHTNTNT